MRYGRLYRTTATCPSEPAGALSGAFSRRAWGGDEKTWNCLAGGGHRRTSPAPRISGADAPSQAKTPPNCWGSLWDVLNTSPADCPLTYAGFTLYGTIDMGAGYNIAGIPFGNSFTDGIYYGIRRASEGGRWSLFPSALSTSVVGLKMEEQIYGDWLLIGAAEFGFSPLSGMLINGPRSLADNNLNTLANQTANGNSSRAGQWDNSQGFVGVSNKTYGTLTFGRVNALTTDVISAYDPVRSNAFSLLGFSARSPASATPSWRASTPASFTA